MTLYHYIMSNKLALHFSLLLLKILLIAGGHIFSTYFSLLMIRNHFMSNVSSKDSRYSLVMLSSEFPEGQGF